MSKVGKYFSSAVVNSVDNYTRWAVQEVNRVCARPCSAYKYGVRLSTASYPSDYVVDELVQSFNMSEDSLR